MSGHKSTVGPCLFFAEPTALRLQSHSGHRFAVTMLPRSRLVGTPNYFAILRHFIRDTTLRRIYSFLFFLLLPWTIIVRARFMSF